MLLTEEQAKTKWCPMTAPLEASPQIPSIVDCSRCKASECMMWRWSCATLKETSLEFARRNCIAKGFCGLAGKGI